MPVRSADGSRLVHLGMSFSNRHPTNDEVAYRARPEARFAPFYADTGEIETDDADLLGLELAAVRGSTWLQSEWIRSKVNAPELGDPKLRERPCALI